MIELPQRAKFVSREDFAAAVTNAYQALWDVYLDEPISYVVPEWVSGACHSVGLPLALASEGGAEHGVASIIKQAVEMKFVSIGKIVRVERDGIWRVFFEAK